VTLIEMMVVVTIIAIFSGIAGFRYFGHLERSKQVAAKTQLNALQLAIAAYYADVARYPTAQEGLAALRQSTAPNWRGPYIIDELPKDPWGRPYQYKVTASGEPRVICLGADGVPGGDGANADVFSWK
jgi:general secretion pathway protein G